MNINPSFNPYIRVQTPKLAKTEETNAAKETKETKAPSNAEAKESKPTANAADLMATYNKVSINTQSSVKRLNVVANNTKTTEKEEAETTNKKSGDVAVGTKQTGLLSTLGKLAKKALKYIDDLLNTKFGKKTQVATGAVTGEIAKQEIAKGVVKGLEGDDKNNQQKNVK